MTTRATTVQITMPQMGESVTEGTILDWRKQEGDHVDSDEPLVEISTDKVDAEVPAPAAGTLTKILAAPDSTVSVGAVLGEIEVNGDAEAPETPEAPAPSSDELVEVAFPEMGDSVAEGTVLEWKVQVGDAVAVDDPLVEISTDKVDAELPSPAAGTIAEILVAADATVTVGSILCRIAAGEKAAAGPVQPPAQPVEERPAADRAPATDGNGAANATPIAARIASAEGVDLGLVQGSGPRGRVTKDDVLAALEGNGAPAQPAGGAVEPIRGPAATLVRFMNESRSIPTATSFRTLSVDVLDARRRALKAAGKRLSFTHLIAWAVVRAVVDMPVMAHSFADQGGKPQRVVPGAIGLGLAVDVERKDGTRSLVVPVLENAADLSFSDFVARYDELVTGARDNTLAPDAYQGANVSLTNPGGIGTVASVPRLMPGQGTIVATGAIGYPPGLKAIDPDKLAELGVQKVMTMTSTYDHRVIQGAESGAFLRRIEELLAGEDGFYEGVFEALGMEVVAEGDATPAAVTAAEPVPATATPAAAPVADASL
ncbi:MAG TPA: biotin/lipoyl-containing protein, partial [Thermoleophilaceae bacterium]|nr:biotin/lipoyl-containing protein [Thermoleophilaceae bacterium]